MAVNEAQTPLPVPPTGVDETNAIHPFNPESGHYEPELKNLPLNANLLSPLAAANFIAVTATARPWIYHLVFANTGALTTVTLAEPGGNTLIVVVPANTTLVLASVPTAPIFVSRTVGNITLLGTLNTVQVTATYTNK